MRSDNGPEFVSKALLKWAAGESPDLALIDPGKPWQNGTTESFNGKFPDECLSMEWFRNRVEAKVVIEQWRRPYNDFRPHSSLGQRTPTEFKSFCISTTNPVMCPAKSGPAGTLVFQQTFPRRRKFVMKKKRFSVEQIVAILKQAELGMPVADVVRQVGISEQTFYRWKKLYSGLQSDQVRELKQLQDENSRLKKLVAELSLDKAVLQDVLSKKFPGPR